MDKYQKVINFIRDTFKTKEFIPLHEPKFFGNEKEYLNDCIDSTFVSSVGKYVDKFEEMIKSYTDSKYAIATVNGTSALHIALILAGVKESDEVITQPLTFVATANAISYCRAKPLFIDVDIDTLGLSPTKLEEFLTNSAIVKDDGLCYNKSSGKVIKACLPMHTFGHLCKIDEIKRVCDKFNITLVEDSAESLGSRYKNLHSGTFGKVGVFSFNGNKTITTGGGGVIITDDENLTKRAKHLTTTAKIPHKYEYIHDEVGFNYRMPNINAALGVAQLELLDKFIESKRELANIYKTFFDSIDIKFMIESTNSYSNYWLNSIVLKDLNERDKFLDITNSNGVMTRPIWKLMNKLDMFKNSQCGNLSNSEFLEDRVINIPSSVRV